MTAHLAYGDDAVWTSNKGRVRKVKLITALGSRTKPFIVRILEGLPGETNQYRVVPPRRLAPEGGGA